MYAACARPYDPTQVDLQEQIALREQEFQDLKLIARKQQTVHVSYSLNSLLKGGLYRGEL